MALTLVITEHNANMINYGNDKMDSNNLVWLTVQGVEKREILEGLGFKIGESGTLSLNGKEVKAIDNPEQVVKVADVKAILPGSLAVITDISEIEMLFPSE